MSTLVSTAEPITSRSRFTRFFALLIGFAVLCFGVVIGGAQPAYAAGQAVSGKIVFPASAPATVRQALDPNTSGDDHYGVYLTLYKDQPGTVEGWQLGADANATYDSTSGVWSIADVPNGTYRLTINVQLPGNGYAQGAQQLVTVNNANVSIVDTVIQESGRLRASLGMCGWQLGDESKQFVKNLDTNNIYQLEPAQSGWGEPSTVCPPDVSFGNYSLPSSGIPAGNYIAFSEWNGNTGYYVGEKLPASPNPNDAVTLNVQNWVGTWVISLMRPTVTAGDVLISGTAKVGQQLTAQATGWTSGAAFTYQWLRGNQSISGATANTYDLTAGDVNAEVSVRVTGTLAGYEDKTATSTSKTVDAAEFLTSPAPTISGTPQVGETLTAQPGTWTPAVKEFDYRWLRGSQFIGGATGNTYALTSEDEGKQISVEVTGSRDGYTSKSETSNAETITSAEFESTPAPTISGTAKVGETLTAVANDWAPVASGKSVRWLRDGEMITGATSETYVLTASDLNRDISVELTGTKAGFVTVRVESTSQNVLVGDLESAKPTLEGTAKVGHELTATAGEWRPAPVEVTYQWLRDGDAIPDATDVKYVLVAADAKHDVSVQVTGTKNAYAPDSLASDAVSVAVGTLTAGTPTISGTAKVGSTLTAKPGTWKPTADKFTYQWLRDSNVIAGANKSTYVPSATDVGRQFSVKVTGSKAGYTSDTKTSVKTAKVIKAEYVAPTQTPFNDVKTNYKFYEPIAWMFTEGLSTGVKTSSGRDYQPKVGVSREAMAAFLYRLEGASYQGPSKSPFADIEKGDKFYNEIAWMHETGLSTGVKQASGKPNYAPKAKVSREAMAAFIYRLEEATTKAPKVSPFGDMHSDDKFYKEISWMGSEGLSTGIKQQSGKPFYAPKASVSREAMAAFLYRLETR